MPPGYLTDVTYVRNFIRETAPAWLDHVALISGFAPPSREHGFSWCDLGCGPGTNAAIMAAVHPLGRFVGIDVLPAHIDEAILLARNAGIPNIRFLPLDFTAATALDLGPFDYIVSHGVYTWIDQAAREQWLGFIDRHLKPGGVLYVSYNAMPGRAADLPLQRLVRALGGTMPGNTREKMDSALDVVSTMAGLKTPALVSSPMMQRLNADQNRLDPDYLAHEFMVPGWDPQCVTDVRAFVGSVGLRPVGSATLVENYDKFVLGRAARQLLSTIENLDARELARDFLIDQFFRRDVFIRGGQRLEDTERSRRLWQSTFFLAEPADEVEYNLTTPAGRLSFDNKAARHIVQALAAGPRRLIDTADASIPDRDLLANVLALSAAVVVWPVEGGGVPVDTINQAVGGRYRVFPCGTAKRASAGAYFAPSREVPIAMSS